jgi:D-threo-aldose 1-dehydrogenase
VCARHDTPLGVAALQFAAAHPAVRTVLLGPRSVDELRVNLAALRREVPAALWDALEAEDLIPRDSPRPARATTALA